MKSMSLHVEHICLSFWRGRSVSTPQFTEFVLIFNSIPNNKDTSLSTHNFYYSKSNSSYMFWLHKATIIRPCVSENVKRKLCSCSHS
jgi:hypothetical protein